MTDTPDRERVVEILSKWAQEIVQRDGGFYAYLSRDALTAAGYSIITPEERQTVEAIATWLHDEVEWPDPDFPDHSWPEHPDDTGQRGDGWLKILPKDTQEQFHEIARRLASRFKFPTPEERQILDKIRAGTHVCAPKEATEAAADHIFDYACAFNDHEDPKHETSYETYKKAVIAAAQEEDKG
jgi:hypothetical protein